MGKNKKNLYNNIISTNIIHTIEEFFMYKKSLIVALTITCFNAHAENPQQRKFTEYEDHSIDPAEIALQNYDSRKIQEKKEAEEKALSSSNKYLYGTISIAVIAGLYAYINNQN